MTRLSALFTLLLVLSGLSLVSSQYRARQLFIDLDRAHAVARKLDVEWRTLQLDQTNYSKNSLIETAAERDLKMQRPTPRRMHFITLPEHGAVPRDLNGTPKIDDAKVDDSKRDAP
jgi:cell division protein FtsL